jgi:hypothetical protein
MSPSGKVRKSSGCSQGRKPDDERHRLRRVKKFSELLQGNVTNELYSFD